MPQFTEAKVTHRGSTLIIPLAEGEDEGQYVCIVPRGNGEKQEIKHAVSIRGRTSIFKKNDYSLNLLLYRITTALISGIAKCIKIG